MQPNGSPGLVRSLGLFATFIITVSAVIGSGVYKKVAPMAAELGSPWLVLAGWVVAGIITLFGALSNAEVASMMADAGGEYVYFKRIYNRFFAFIFGWSCFTVIRSSALASIAYVFAQSFDKLIPLPEFSDPIAGYTVLGIFTPLDNFGVKALTILLIFSLTVFNVFGIKTGERLSRYVLLTVLGSMVLVAILGLSMGGGSMDNLSVVSSTVQVPTFPSMEFITHFFTAMLAAFWAYEGWASTGYLGAEIKNANRNLPLALVSGVLFIIAIYLLMNFTYLYVMPVDTLVEANQSPNTIAAILVVERFLGENGVVFISLVILFTTFGATNSTVLPPPRLYYAMAKDGLFFKLASFVHPRYHTPSKALFLQAGWSSLLVLSGSFDQLTNMLVFGAFIFFGAVTLGVFILRVREPETPRPYRAWGYPVVPAIFILFCLILIGVTFYSKPREALLGAGLMLTGIPFWLFWNRRYKKANL